MKLSEINTDIPVKVGSVQGKSYFYTGKLKDADFEKIDKNLYKTAKKDFENALRLMKEKSVDDVDKKQVTKFNKAFTSYADYIPVAEREVVEQWESIAEPGVTAILVEGGGDGDAWMVNEKSTADVKNADGAAALVVAVYKSICDELTSNYIFIFSEKKQFKIDRCKAIIRRLEHEIKDNVYNAYNDPNGIIRAAFDNAVDIISERHKINKRDVRAVLKEKLA